MGADAGVRDRMVREPGRSTVGDRWAGPLGRVVDRSLAVLAAVPVAALVLLASMVVRVRLADGAWPSRNQPDPKDLGWHNSITAVTIVLSFLVAAVVPVATGLVALAGHRRVAIAPLLVSLGAVVVLVVVLVADPGGIGQWIAD